MLLCSTGPPPNTCHCGGTKIRPCDRTTTALGSERQVSDVWLIGLSFGICFEGCTLARSPSHRSCTKGRSLSNTNEEGRQRSGGIRLTHKKLCGEPSAFPFRRTTTPALKDHETQSALPFPIVSFKIAPFPCEPEPRCPETHVRGPSPASQTTTAPRPQTKHRTLHPYQITA